MKGSARQTKQETIFYDSFERTARTTRTTKITRYDKINDFYLYPQFAINNEEDEDYNLF